MSGQASISAPPARVPADQAADRRQLDLFLDGRDALLVHEIVTGLMSRDVERTEAGLRRLGEETGFVIVYPPIRPGRIHRPVRPGSNRLFLLGLWSHLRPP